MRNWIKTFAPYLSPGASPTAGTERILTPADVALLQFVKAQRDQLKDYEQIAAELAAMPPGEAIEPYIDVTATAAPQEPPQLPTVATLPIELVQTLQRLADGRQDDLQRQIDDIGAAQGDRLQWFMFGIVAGILLVGVVAALVLAGGMLR